MRKARLAVFIATLLLCAWVAQGVKAEAPQTWEKQEIPENDILESLYEAHAPGDIICQVIVPKHFDFPTIHFRAFNLNWKGKEVGQLIWIWRENDEGKTIKIVKEIYARDRETKKDTDGYDVFDMHCKKLLNDLPQHLKDMTYDYANRE